MRRIATRWDDGFPSPTPWLQSSPSGKQVGMSSSRSGKHHSGFRPKASRSTTLDWVGEVRWQDMTDLKQIHPWVGGEWEGKRSLGRERGRHVNTRPPPYHGTREAEKKNGNLLEQQHMKTSSPPDQKIDPMPPLQEGKPPSRCQISGSGSCIIVSRSPQTADCRRRYAQRKASLRRGADHGGLLGEGHNSCRYHLLEPALSLSGSKRTPPSSPPKRAGGCRPLASEADPIGSGVPSDLAWT
jgi:hypothetical protein